MQRVKPVKDRWPPQPRVVPSIDEDHFPKDSTHNVMVDIVPSISTQELLVAFESGKFRQTTDLSPDAIQQAASNRARESSLLSPVGCVKRRQRSFESIERTRPLLKTRSAHDDLPSVPSSARAANKRRNRRGRSDSFDDNSTLSSHQEAFRSSYKVQYLGAREWDIGQGDSSFPPMVRRFVEPLNMDYIGTVSCSSELIASRQGHFDASDALGLRMCYYPQGHDRRFESSAALDCAPGGPPPTDRRFDAASSAGLPPVPHRSRDPAYIPTVWQTRVLEGEEGADADNRKWRLKRVWEHAQDKSIIVDDNEPEYLVDESDLESALTSLLGVPSRISFDPTKPYDQDTVFTSSESTFAELETPELAQNRWDTSGGNRDPQLMQPWRIQRVWDRDGEICHVEDERSLDDAELLAVFNNDEALNNKTEQNDVDDNSDSDSFFSEASGDDSASCHNDPFDDDEFDACLDDLSDDTNEDDGNHDLHLIRRKLEKVESWIRKLAAEKSDNTKEREKLLKQLQEKCLKYLAELTLNFAKLERQQIHSNTRLPSKISVEITGLDATECNESNSDGDGDLISADGNGKKRDNMLVAKKLQKTERLMTRMVADKGEEAKTKKLYRRLDEKRTGYIEEMGLGFYPLENTTGCLKDNTDPNAHSFSDLTITSSLHSILGKLKCLDVIFEDESSNCSIEEERRDPVLLRRKIRKVENLQLKIVAKNGKKGKSKKLYKRLEEKRVQYQKELEGFSPAELAKTPSKARRTLRKRVEQAIGLMQISLEQTEEENITSSTFKTDHALRALGREHQQVKSSDSPAMERTTNLACKNAGKWTSPLNQSSHTTAGDDLKMTIHSLESVYL
jgi:hypothetical protein